MTKTNSTTLNKVEVYPYLTSNDAARVKTRVKFEGNVTSSVVDQVFDAYRNKALTVNDKMNLSSWNFRLNALLGTIEMHLEKRVSQLFMQAVLCYNTKYTFREGHTVHQGFGAHTLKTGNGELEQHAAHHATLPCLYASSNGLNEEIVFLYRSAFYDESNATVDVEKAVNEADRAIDEKRKDSLLRTKTVALLNKAAKGEMTPPQVVEAFIQDMIVEINKSIRVESDPKVVDVLNLYLEKAQELTDYVKNPDNIDRWLDLRIDDPKLYADKPSVIDSVKRRISELPLAIHAERHQKQNESHIPAHFYDLFHYQVLSRFKHPELEIVEKAVGITLKDLEAKVKSFKYTKRTNALIQQHIQKIDRLVKEVMPLAARGRDNGDMPDGVFSARKICLRPSLYRLRYGMIFADQQAQSVVKGKFESTLNKVKNASSAKFLESFFNRAVFQKAPSQSERTMFCKLLNISEFVLNQQIREVKVNKNAHKYLDNYTSNMVGILNRISERIKSGTVNAENKQKIKADIDAIWDQVRSSCKVSQNKLKSLYYRRLYDYADSIAEENLLAELLGKGKAAVDLEVAGYQKKTGAEKDLEEQAAEVQAFAGVAFDEIAKLNAKSMEFQRKLLLELREAHGMKQKHFVGVYKTNNPGSAMNTTRLSELENGGRKLTSDVIEKTSKIYGIHSSLFSPSTFAERAA